MKISHKFVQTIPETIEDGMLYISLKYSTAVHNCFCGCGNEVVTPLSDTGWKLSLNGKAVSLYPSIGNWSLPCQSHYWITNDEVRWAPKWTKEEIARGRQREEFYANEYYENTYNPKSSIIQQIKRLINNLTS